MKFFIIKLFAIVLIFTQSPVSAMLAENEPEDQLRPTYDIPIVEVDIQTFKQCVTLYNYEECLSNVVNQAISSLTEECHIFSVHQDQCVSEYGSDEFVEAIASTIEAKINSLSDQDKLVLKYQIIAPNPKSQQNDDNSLRPIVIKNNSTLVLAGTVPRKPPVSPDGPSRTDEGDEDDPLLINIPDTAWPWLDEGDSDDGY